MKSVEIEVYLRKLERGQKDRWTEAIITFLLFWNALKMHILIYMIQNSNMILNLWNISRDFINPLKIIQVA